MKTSIPLGSFVLLLALGLAGCAVHSIGSEVADTRAALPSEASPKGPGDPRGEGKVSETKKAPARTAAVMSSVQRQTAGQSEASCPDVQKCASALKAMVTGNDRSWIRRPAAPTVLANGVRLFAYRALRPSLSCGDLAAGLSEVEAATRTFSGPVAGLEAQQAERVRRLSGEVGNELRAERVRRCPAGDKNNGTVG